MLTRNPQSQERPSQPLLPAPNPHWSNVCSTHTSLHTCPGYTCAWGAGPTPSHHSARTGEPQEQDRCFQAVPPRAGSPHGGLGKAHAERVTVSTTL